MYHSPPVSSPHHHGHQSSSHLGGTSATVRRSLDQQPQQHQPPSSSRNGINNNGKGGGTSVVDMDVDTYRRAQAAILNAYQVGTAEADQQGEPPPLPGSYYYSPPTARGSSPLRPRSPYINSPASLSRSASSRVSLSNLTTTEMERSMVSASTAAAVSTKRYNQYHTGTTANLTHHLPPPPQLNTISSNGRHASAEYLSQRNDGGVVNSTTTSPRRSKSRGRTPPPGSSNNSKLLPTYGYMHWLPTHPRELERKSRRSRSPPPQQPAQLEMDVPHQPAIAPYQPPSRLLENILRVPVDVDPNSTSWLAKQQRSTGLSDLLKSTSAIYATFLEREAVDGHNRHPLLAKAKVAEDEAWQRIARPCNTSVRGILGTDRSAQVRKVILERLLHTVPTNIASNNSDVDNTIIASTTADSGLILNMTSPVTVEHLLTPLRLSGQAICAEEHTEWQSILSAWRLRQCCAYFFHKATVLSSSSPPIISKEAGLPPPASKQLPLGTGQQQRSAPAQAAAATSKPATPSPVGYWIGCGDAERQQRLVLIAVEEQSWLRLWCGGDAPDQTPKSAATQDSKQPTTTSISSSSARPTPTKGGTQSNNCTTVGPLEVNPYYRAELERLRALQSNKGSLVATELLLDSYLAAINERKALLAALTNQQHQYDAFQAATAAAVAAAARNANNKTPTPTQATPVDRVDKEFPTAPTSKQQQSPAMISLLQDVDSPMKSALKTPTNSRTHTAASSPISRGEGPLPNVPAPPLPIQQTPPTQHLPPLPPKKDIVIPFVFEPTGLLQVEEYATRAHLSDFFNFSWLNTLESESFWSEHRLMWGTHREHQFRTEIKQEERDAFKQWASGFWSGFFKVKQIECEKWEEEDRADWALRRDGYIASMYDQMITFQRVRLVAGGVGCEEGSYQSGWEILRYSSLPRLFEHRLRRIHEHAASTTTQDRLLQMFTGFINFLVGSEVGDRMAAARELLVSPYRLPPLPRAEVAVQTLRCLREFVDDFTLLEDDLAAPSVLVMQGGSERRRMYQQPEVGITAGHGGGNMDTYHFPASYDTLLSTYYYDRGDASTSPFSGGDAASDTDFHFALLEVPLRLVSMLQDQSRTWGANDDQLHEDAVLLNRRGGTVPRSVVHLAPLLTECEGSHRDLLVLAESELRFKVLLRLFHAVRERLEQRETLNQESVIRYSTYADEGEVRNRFMSHFFAMSALLIQGSILSSLVDGGASIGDAPQIGWLPTIQRGARSPSPHVHHYMSPRTLYKDTNNPSFEHTLTSPMMGELYTILPGTSQEAYTHHNHHRPGTGDAYLPVIGLGNTESQGSGGVPSLRFRLSTEAGSRQYIEELERRSRAHLWFLCHSTPLRLMILHDETSQRDALLHEEGQAWQRGITWVFFTESTVNVANGGSGDNGVGARSSSPLLLGSRGASVPSSFSSPGHQRLLKDLSMSPSGYDFGAASPSPHGDLLPRSKSDLVPSTQLVSNDSMLSFYGSEVFSPPVVPRCSMALAALQLHMEPNSRWRLEGMESAERKELLTSVFYPFIVLPRLIGIEAAERVFVMVSQEMLERRWLEGAEYVWMLEAELRVHAQLMFKRGLSLRNI